MWFRYSERKMVELFANSGDPDQQSLICGVWSGSALFAKYNGLINPWNASNNCILEYFLYNIFIII